MKKLFILTTVALVSFASCSDDPVTTPTKKQEDKSLTVEKKQRAFIGYVGATWCPPCGSAGGPGFKEIRKTYTTDDLVGFYFAPSGGTVAYVDGGSPVSYASEMMSNVMKSSGTIPYFSINGVNVGGAYNSPATTLGQYKGSIDDMISQSPEIGIAATQTLTGDKLSCEVAVEAFEDFTGDIYYSVMAVEKKVIGFQKVSGSPDNNAYEHKYVMRASLIGDGTINGQELFKAISTGEIKTGTKFSETFSLDYTKIESTKVINWDYTPDNTILVASVWLKGPKGEYTYVNSVTAAE